MTGSGTIHNISSILLFMVAGTPLLMAIFCPTPLGRTVGKVLPLAPLPACIAAFTVPLGMVVKVPWFFMGGMMGLDSTGRIFLAVTSFIWFLAALSSRGRHRFDKKADRFNGFFLAAMMGNFGLILAQEMLGFYLFFALMSFSAYGLVVHRSSHESRRAGRIYLFMVMIAEIAMFMAIVMIADSADSLALKDIGGGALEPVTLALLFIGFGMKIGAMPFHSWMPPAYQAAPVSAAAALSGAMVNAGILGWLRFLPLGQVTSLKGAQTFIALGALAAIYGVIAGLCQRKAGKILACSSISQMGLLTVLFGLGLTSYEAGHLAPFILILYAVHHALAKSSLFLGLGTLEQNPRDLSLRQFSGFFLPALALAGLPLTSGSIAKAGFKEFTVSIGDPWYTMGTYFFPLTALGTTLLMMHFLSIVKSSRGEGETEVNVFRTPWLISIMAAALPLWLWPAARIYAEHALEPLTLWQALWPAGLGVLLYPGLRGIARFLSSHAGMGEGQGNTFDYPDSFFTLTNKWVSKEWLPPPRMPDFLFSASFSLQLRNMEKKLGRWTIVGLFYLILCFIMVCVTL